MAGFYVLRPEAIRIKFALAEDSESKTKWCRELFIFSTVTGVHRRKTTELQTVITSTSKLNRVGPRMSLTADLMSLTRPLITATNL